MIKVVDSLYTGAVTCITVGKTKTRPICINSGVKQGCPLSPLLFNLVIDELAERLDATGCGLEIDGNIVSSMAFADDYVLLAKDSVEMNVLMNVCGTFFEEKGLAVNPAKCQSLRVLPVKGKKRSMKVLTRTHRWWKVNNQDVEIPSMTYESVGKYLGVTIDPAGKIALPIEEWKLWLTRLRKCSLKPEQKVKTLREVVCARINYVLRMSDCGICELRKWSRFVRGWVKSIIHFPTWCSSDWLHMSGGLGIPDVSSGIVIQRLRAVEKMAMSDDGVVRVVGARLAQRNRVLWNRAGLAGIELKAAKKYCEVKRLNKVGSLTNGGSLKTIAESSVSRHWLMEKNIRPGNKILVWKAMAGVIPTKINLTRGVADQTLKKCRCCGKTAETDGHILAGCPTSQNAYSKRHNMLCDKVARELKLKGGPSRRVWREKMCLAANGRHYKPDIVVKDDNVITVIDMTCPYEKSEGYLIQSEDAKVAKYEPLKRDAHWTREIEGNNGIMATSIEVVGIAVGAVGTITRSTFRKLNELKLGKIARSLQIIACNESAQIIRRHLSGLRL